MYNVKERAKTCKSLCGILLIENIKRGVSTDSANNYKVFGPITATKYMTNIMDLKPSYRRMIRCPFDDNLFFFNYVPLDKASNCVYLNIKPPCEEDHGMLTLNVWAIPF